MPSREDEMRGVLTRLTTIWLAAAVLALAACSNSTSSTADEICDSATVEAEPALPGEARAESVDDIEVWALSFATWPLPPGGPIRIPVGEEVKIVWRSTGAGRFAIESRTSEAAAIDPTWGPEAHDSSNWSRPGQEWGTGWIFPSTGCWTFGIRRGDAKATMRVEVFDSSVSDSAAAG
ncbi:MAG: hypothetical protein ABIP17_09215 [Ilumatobacteraceae bacterium]